MQLPPDQVIALEDSGHGLSAARAAGIAQVLVTVNDPLALEGASAGLPPLVIGSFVQVSLQGRLIEDVARIDRALAYIAAREAG